MVKKNFIKPNMEVIKFDAEDIIRTSGETPCEMVCVNKCLTVCANHDES